jgi:predicted polyphosphate/ATP-dependent NAD kinase
MAPHGFGTSGALDNMNEDTIDILIRVRGDGTAELVREEIGTAVEVDIEGVCEYIGLGTEQAVVVFVYGCPVVDGGDEIWEGGAWLAS